MENLREEIELIEIAGSEADFDAVARVRQALCALDLHSPTSVLTSS